ncbi:MAG TPA: hypothetical protein DER09_10615 [Prolixibacteraceae bacterium]|nr:hypothetical protein [Prolixibacteraceae bacterium]
MIKITNIQGKEHGETGKCLMGAWFTERLPDRLPVGGSYRQASSLDLQLFIICIRMSCVCSMLTDCFVTRTSFLTMTLCRMKEGRLGGEAAQPPLHEIGMKP